MPMALPDGHVYSREVRRQMSFASSHDTNPRHRSILQALEEMAAKNDGDVIRPGTEKRHEFASLRKVFIS